jgi:hypothetical protein
MKTKLIIFLIALSFFSFGQISQTIAKPVEQDTINMTDANGKKQGKWILRGTHKPGSGYSMHQKIEEGLYKNNRKTGLWINYYPNGKIKSEINFEDGKPGGSAKTYYENGKKQEEGTWKSNRWIGSYKTYDQDGKMKEIIFDENGKAVKKWDPNSKEIYDLPDKKVIKNDSPEDPNQNLKKPK